MEPTQTEFNLTTAITTWQQSMLNGSLTSDDVTELTQHIYDAVSELQKKGLTDEESWLLARHRIGKPELIDTEFSKVNPDFIASRNWLMLFWGGTIFMLMQTVFLILPGYSKFILVKQGQPILTDGQTYYLLYSFTILMTVWLCISLYKANNLSIWFNTILAKYSAGISLVLIIVGSFAATLNYNYLSNSAFRRVGNNAWVFNDIKDCFGVVFYGSLIFCTTWFTMRYRKQEFRNFASFASNLSWPMSLAIGIMIEMIISFGNLIHSQSIKYLLIGIFFGAAGWMVGQSKNYKLNIISIQLCAFYICWFIRYYSAGQPLMWCTIEYLSTIVFLFIGFAITRKNILRNSVSLNN